MCATSKPKTNSKKIVSDTKPKKEFVITTNVMSDGERGNADEKIPEYIHLKRKNEKENKASLKREKRRESIKNSLVLLPFSICLTKNIARN